MLAQFIATFMTYFVQLKTTLKLWWLRVNISTAAAPRNSKQLHKIIFAGDGYAEGYGDWITFGHEAGTTTHIRRMIQAKKSIRSAWKTYNRGRYLTATEDWLPSTPDGLFDKTFKTPALKDAEVVVVLLGTMDGRGEELTAKSIEAIAQRYRRNIQTICEEIAAMGKYVFVSKVWKSGQEGDRLKLADRKNELLVQYFEKCDKKGKIREGPSLCDYKFNNDRELYTNDGVHFSSKGYKLLAALTLEAINTVLTKVEFDSVRNELYGRHETERRDSLLGGVRAESKEEAKVLDLDSNSDADSDTELHTSKDK